jgi:hypothetical protein
LPDPAVEQQVQGVPPGLIAEPLAPAGAPVQGVPAGLTAEPLSAPVARPAAAATPQVTGVPTGMTAEPLTTMAGVAGATPGTQTPGQAAGHAPLPPGLAQPGMAQPLTPNQPREEGGWFHDFREAMGDLIGGDMPGASALRESIGATPQEQHARNVADAANPANPLTQSVARGALADEQAQEVLNKPIFHNLEPSEADRQKWEQNLPADQQALLAKKRGDAKQFVDKHPVLAGAADSVTDALEGLTSPMNIGMMAMAPQSKLMSGIFAAQAAKGSYDSASAALDAYKDGRNKDAAKLAMDALASAGIATLAGVHAAGEATPRVDLRERGTAIPPKAEVRGVGGGAEAATVEGAKPTNVTDVTKPVPEFGEPIGTKDPETGRPVVQASENPEVNQELATDEHPEVKKAITALVKPIDGAELAGARDEKDAGRRDEKIAQEGQSPQTVRDYSGYRIAVATPQAAEEVAQALRQRFEVHAEQNEFQRGQEETGFHGHTMNVREPGSPVSHEVQILPREVAENADADHAIYEKARDGDKDAAAELTAKNEANWQAFQERQGSGVRGQGSGSLPTAGEGGRGEPSEQAGAAQAAPEPQRETRYKHGNTQANIPDDSEASTALEKGKPGAAGPIQKGSVVALKDGTAGVVRHYQQAVNGAPERASVVLADGSRRDGLRPDDMTAVTAPAVKPGSKWVGVDVDGTLAHYDGWKGASHIGKPIQPMVDRVKQMLAQGKDVRIFTARVSEDPTGQALAAVQAWSQQHLGQVLPVTNVKDAHMEQLFDDRAVQVGRNEGSLVGGEAAADAAGAPTEGQSETEKQSALGTAGKTSGDERFPRTTADDLTTESGRSNAEVARNSARVPEVSAKPEIKPKDASKASPAATPRPSIERPSDDISPRQERDIRRRSEDQPANERQSMGDDDRSTANKVARSDVRQAESDRTPASATAVRPDLGRSGGAVPRDGDKRGGGQSEVSVVVRSGQVGDGSPRGRGSDGLRDQLIAKGRFDRELSAAQSRSVSENAARATLEQRDTPHGAIAVLNPDGYRLMQKLLSPDTSWAGVYLDKASASKWVARLRAVESRMRQTRGERAGADAVGKMALAMDKMRDPDGGMVLLRGDHDESAQREEMAHRWQTQAGLRGSEAQLDVANQEDFEGIYRVLHADLGYQMHPQDMATELIAKALAGDTQIPWAEHPDVQNAIVEAALKAAVDEMGSGILDTLPPADPAVQPAIEKARAYARELEASQPAAGSGPGGLGQKDGGSAREERGQPGRDVSGKSGLTGNKGRPDLSRPSQKAKAELDREPLFKRDREAEEQNPWYLKSQKLIEDKMRESLTRDGVPLFKKAARETTVTTGDHDTGKPLEEMVEGLRGRDTEKLSMADRVKLGVDQAREVAGKVNSALKPESVGHALEKVKGAAAGVRDAWARPQAWSDYLESLGDLRKAEFDTSRVIDQYQRELKRVAPKPADRAAMTVFSEAKNEQQLREWAAKADQFPEKSPGRKFAQAFKDAANLTDEQKAIAKSHRDYYDAQLETLQKAGLLPQGATQYVMHMFASDPEALEKMTAVTDFSELQPNPSFLNRRVYKSYFDAIEGGEEPRTLDAGKILSAYQDAFAKTFMTRSFLRSMIYGTDTEAGGDGRPLAVLQSRDGWVQVDKDPSGREQILKQPKRPESADDYVRIPSSQMRNFVWEMTDADREILAPGYKDMPKAEQSKLFTDEDPRFPVPKDKILAMKGDLLIHPRYAGRVHDLVTKSWLDTAARNPAAIAAKGALNATLKGSALAKSIVLFGGAFHQVTESWRAAEHLVNPFTLPDMDEVAKNKDVQELVRHGMNLTQVDSEGVLAGGILPSYHRWLFRDFIPRIKAEVGKRALKTNTRLYGDKLTKDEIHLLTAKQANATTGGLDPAFFQHLYRMNNKTYKAAERMGLFAPDFLKSSLQYGAQSFGRYGAVQRRALVMGFIAMYTAARILNAVLNKGDAHWDAQDALSVVTPKDLSIDALANRRFGLRMLQGDMMNAVLNTRNFVYNRLNPMTVRPTIELLTGRDQFGRQTTPGHVLGSELKSMAPITVQKMFTTTDEGLVESMLTGMGLQTSKYRSPAETLAHRLRIQAIPDKPESDDKQDEQRRNVQYAEKMRDGKMSSDELVKLVDAGKLSPREARSIERRASMSDLQYDVDHLSDPGDVLKVFAAAHPDEKQELQPILEAKRRNGMKGKSEEERAQLEKMFEVAGLN